MTLNLVTVAILAVVAGCLYGYFSVAFFWLLFAWWWKSLNLWRVAIGWLMIFGVCLTAIGIGIYISDPLPDTNYNLQMTLITGGVLFGFLCFYALNRSKLARHDGNLD